MKMLARFTLVAGLALAVVAGLSIAPRPVVKTAEAATTVMCAPQLADTAAARVIGQSIGNGTQSPIPSGSLYSLNGQGCTLVKQSDVNWFLGQGFSPGPPFGANILYTTGVQTGALSFQIGVLPPNTYIQHVIAVNSTGNAVTGGIGIGTAASGSQIVAPASFSCAANCTAFVADSAFVTRIPNSGAGTPIFASANGTSGSWNNANITITVVYGYY